MGFLDSLKSVGNFITGGGATVSVMAESPALGRPFTVVVRAVAKGADVKVSRVYLKVQGVEEVVVDDVPTAIEEEVDGQRRLRLERRDFRQETVTWSHEFTVAGAQTLAANSEQEWRGEVSLPPNALPTFVGRKARHIWQLYAGLDTFGNDPDSGWVTIEIWE